MIKAIIFAALAFVISAAATTGVMVKLHRPPPDSLPPAQASVALAHPDSAGTDSTSVPRPDSVSHDSASGGPEPAAAATATGAVPHRPAAPAVPAPAGPARDPEPDPAALAAAYKQVARVLAAMKPPQAAKVLSQLSDDEVEGILRAVGPRQAADFLANLSVERAGVLSRRLLTPDERAASR